MPRQLLLLSVFIMAFQSCLTTEQTYPALPPGPWRAVLKIGTDATTPVAAEPTDDSQKARLADIQPGELPFNFEVIYDDDSTFHIEIINGEERLIIPAEDISFGRSSHRARDTIRIEFPIYASYITGSYAGGVIEGNWVVTTRDNYAIPFVAHHGKSFRFTTLKTPPVADLSGRWAATFEIETDHPYPAIAEFKQQANQLTGTFLTETGDYRFLEGTVQGEKFWLSCFDGSHAFLFEGKILEGGDSLTGAFYSGKHYKTLWVAHRDQHASLPDPDSLTFLKPGFDRLTFSFENPEGKLISPDDPAYAGKIKIIQIMGTWCPNCRDETNFLVDYFKRHQPNDVAVIALAFEKHKDKEKAMEALRRYKERFGFDWEILLAGSADKNAAAEALPMLDRLLAYPTMIFLDKNNKVVRIHTGFSGPATSEYQAFAEEFHQFLNRLRSTNMQ